MYYGTPAHNEIKGVWCHPCYTEIKSELVPLDGFNIRKAELEKRKNEDEVGWAGKRPPAWLGWKAPAGRLSVPG